MNKANGRALLIVSGFALTLALAGCVGYVEGDGGGVVAAEPDVYLFGGYYDGGPYRDYGRRGADSRRGFGRAGRDGGAARAPVVGRPGGTTIVPTPGRPGGGGRR
jgi:hypothetical protein